MGNDGFGVEETFHGVIYQISYISDIYIVIHTSSKNDKYGVAMKQCLVWESAQHETLS